MLKKYILSALVLAGMLVFTGCGEKEELTMFKEEISNFYTEVSALEAELDSIDEQSENAVSTIMISLEQMNEQFQKLAEIEVPTEFISVEELAEDAASYMYEAVRLYGEA